MMLPPTITAGELADLDNSAAQAIWQAHARGQVVVKWHSAVIQGIRRSEDHRLFLELGKTTRIFVSATTVLTIERVE